MIKRLRSVRCSVTIEIEWVDTEVNTATSSGRNTGQSLLRTPRPGPILYHSCQCKMSLSHVWLQVCSSYSELGQLVSIASIAYFILLYNNRWSVIILQLHDSTCDHWWMVARSACELALYIKSIGYCCFICDWVCKNRPKMHKNWNPIYCWTACKPTLLHYLKIPDSFLLTVSNHKSTLQGLWSQGL